MSCQRPASSSAPSRISRPSGTTRPVSSATETKWAGESSPFSGWFQRASASTPMILSVDEVDERLEVHLELVARDAAAHVGGELHLADGVLVHLGLEHGEPVLAAALGLVEGQVGVPHDVLDVLGAAAAVGDADAGGDEKLGTADAHRLGERLDDARGDPLHLGVVVDVLDEDRRTRRRPAGPRCPATAAWREAVGRRCGAASRRWRGPRLSFTFLKSSRSANSTANSLPLRWLRSTA